MSPAEAANMLAALNWSGVPLGHQMAVSAALETLRGNVIPLPARPRTRWTSICHLHGGKWATSSGFGPDGAWGWILETVAHELGVSEDQIGCAESGEDQPYDCDDLVTVDGLPVYRIRHFST